MEFTRTWRSVVANMDMFIVSITSLCALATRHILAIASKRTLALGTKLLRRLIPKNLPVLCASARESPTMSTVNCPRRWLFETNQPGSCFTTQPISICSTLANSSLKLSRKPRPICNITSPKRKFR
eukprot:07742_3